MRRIPSFQSCTIDECQMSKRCSDLIESWTDFFYEETRACSGYMPPVQEAPMFTKFEHKRKLNDE